MFMLYLLLLPELIRGTTLTRLLHARTARTMLGVSVSQRSTQQAV